MKKAALYERAERLYISAQNTFDEIAAMLGVSERTLRTWADEGKWQNKRVKLVAQQESLDERLYNFVTKLMDRAEKDLENPDGQIDVGRLYTITRLVDKLQKAHQYEGTLNTEKTENAKDPSGGVSEETLTKIEKQLSLL